MGMGLMQEKEGDVMIGCGYVAGPNRLCSQSVVDRPLHPLWDTFPC